jgi:hypothetical protein
MKCAAALSKRNVVTCQQLLAFLSFLFCCRLSRSLVRLLMDELNEEIIYFIPRVCVYSISSPVARCIALIEHLLLQYFF